MAKNTDVDKELIKEKLEYIGLDLNKVPKFLKEYEPLNFRPVRAYNQTTTYKVYKHINVQDIEILITPSDRLTDLKERYKLSSPLYTYLMEDDEEGIEKFSVFLTMLSNMQIEKVEELENEQKELKKHLPTKIKYKNHFIWQIYYSDYAQKYFMLVPTNEQDNSELFYILKKQISSKKTRKKETIFVPIAELEYSGIFLSNSEIADIENYLWYFTKEWPSIYEVYDLKNKLSLKIVVPVKLVAEMTPEYSYSFAKDKMGLSTLVSSYKTTNGEELSDVNLWALALGSLTRGVTVRAMTAAYATFANEGVWREARTYTVVKDSNGQVILDNTQESHVAMKDMTAWYITDMLKSTVEKGTGTAAQLENMTVAGKTGTTSRDFDRWFAGYTPYYTGVVWCGYNDPEEIVLTDSDTNPSIVMWQKVMHLVHQSLKDKSFKQPANLVEVTVCRDSGLLPSDACALDPRGDRTVRVTLSAHDVPTTQCTAHKLVEICNASGHVANEFCAQVPGNATHKVALLDVSRAFPKNGVVVLDQAYAILTGDLPAGYYAAVSPDVDSINVECYIHSEDDLPEPEPEEDSEEDSEEDTDPSQSVIDRIRDSIANGDRTP